MFVSQKQKFKEKAASELITPVHLWEEPKNTGKNKSKKWKVTWCDKHCLMVKE